MTGLLFSLEYTVLYVQCCCNSTVATVRLQQYCCNSTVTIVLLQQHCCNSTVATVLLQQYCCNSTVACDAVSLEIPGIVVSLEIPVFRILSRKKLRKFVKICFLDSRDQNKILKFLWFFLYGQYFLYKSSTPSSQPSKTFKIELTISKSTWGTTFSSFRPLGTPFRPDLPPKIMFRSTIFRFFWPLFALFDFILSDLWWCYLI